MTENGDPLENAVAEPIKDYGLKAFNIGLLTHQPSTMTYFGLPDIGLSDFEPIHHFGLSPFPFKP